jgi:predicted HTH transcriptional regulator
MRRQHLRELIAGGESLTVEFKRKFTSEEKIAREVAAFANSSGGYLMIGVDDDKRIVGVQSEKGEIDQVEHVCEYCIDPPVEHSIDIVNIEYKDVVVVHVPESHDKPHRLLVDGSGSMLKPSDRPVYVRQGSAAIQASKEVAKVLEADNINSKPVTLSIGKHERRLFEYLEQFERITSKQFAEITNISERRAGRLLVRLVHVGALRIFTHEKQDYYTLAE